MIIVVDTCIIIDALENRDPFGEDAKIILKGSANKLFDGYITAKSISDIYYLLHKYFHSNEQTHLLLNKITNFIDIADTNAIDVRNTLLSNYNDFEDGLMVETAKRINADYIVTRNIKDFKNSPIKAIEPKELIKLLGI